MRTRAASLAGFLLLCGHAVAALVAPQPVAPVTPGDGPPGTYPKTSRTPEFHWGASPGATWYTFRILNPTDWTIAFETSIQATTSYTLPEENALTVGRTYIWGVRGWNQAEGYGPWSVLAHFTVGRVRYYAVSPADCVPAGAPGGWRMASGRVERYSNEVPCTSFTARVHLPDGAVIVRFTSCWTDLDPHVGTNSWVGNVYCALMHVNRKQVSGSLAKAHSAGSPGLSTTTTTLITWPYVEGLQVTHVDNQDFSYLVSVYFCGKDMSFRGAEIEYLE